MRSTSFHDNNSSDMRFLVAITHTAQSAELLVWADELARKMQASLQAIYVESKSDITSAQREQLDKNIALAKKYGIEMRIISNYDTVKGIARFALKENITHILIGKPKSYNLLTFLRRGDFVNKLIKYTGNQNVYILGSDQPVNKKYRERVSLPSFSSHSQQYLITSLIIIAAALGCHFIQDFVGYRVLSFVLLFVVSVLAFFYGTGPILLASTISALIWNFFFIPPHYTLHIDNTEDTLMFFMFFIIALLNGVLTSRVRNQEMKIRIREERTHALYQLTKDLTAVSEIPEVVQLVVSSIQKYFDMKAVVIINEDILHPVGDFEFDNNEKSAIAECFEKSIKGGRYTPFYPSQRYSYYPMVGNQIKAGVIVLNQQKQFTYGEEQFWEACLSQITGKFEREMLRDLAKKAYLLDESDKLYKTLFNSISHEFRIPVTAILGATDTLLSEKYPEDIQHKLLNEINIASIRLNHLIENLLNMSRLESGRISLRTDWCDVHDLVNRVTNSLKQELLPFKLKTDIPADMPFIKIDFGLMEQVIHNLLLNATQYTSIGSTITIGFTIENTNLILTVADQGEGFSTNELTQVFDKFYRGKSLRTGGTGLGLSIVKGFVEAHKGTVEVKNNLSGGALFTITIPIEIAPINELNN